MRVHRDIKHPKRGKVVLEKQGRNWVILRGGGEGFNNGKKNNIHCLSPSRISVAPLFRAIQWPEPWFKLQEKRNNKSVAKMIVFLGVLKSLNVLVHSILAGQLVGPTITVQRIAVQYRSLQCGIEKLCNEH